MGGRHRVAGASRRRVARGLVVLVVVAVAAAVVTVVAVQTVAGTDRCSRENAVELTVAADPAVSSVLREVATDWRTTAEPAIDGRCVSVEVVGATTAEVASALTQVAGGAIDLATPVVPPAGLDGPPAVWVPDSSYWIARMQAINRTLFAPDPQSLATSPIVLAATPPAADLLGNGPVAPSELAQLVEQQVPLTVAEPRRDTAGLVGAVWLQNALAPEESDLPAAVGLFRGLGQVPPDSLTLLRQFGEELAAAPVSEQALLAHNATQPRVPVTAVPVAEAPTLDFPYAVLTDLPEEVQTAAGMFRDALSGAGETYARHGFRAGDGAVGAQFRVGHGVTAEPVAVQPVAPSDQVSSVLRIWVSSRSDARVLSVVNVNASMLEPMEPGGAIRRVDVFRATASQGIELFTPDSQLGVWEYGEDWTEVLPIATLTDAHKQAVLDATGEMEIRSDDTSAMFETLLDAYQEMKAGYDPGRSNTLLLWSDGGDNLPDGPSLDQTQRELERLVDVTRPIRVILLGLGPDADMAQLEAIAETTGGGAYQLLDPDQISLIFLQALLT